MMRKYLAVMILCLLLLGNVPTQARVVPQSAPAAVPVGREPVTPPEPLNSLSNAEGAGMALRGLSAPSGASAVQADAENVEFVGHIGGGTRAVTVQGDYAYIGVGPRLTILDISDRASPAVVGKTSLLPAIVYDVNVSGDYAYVAADEGDLRIVDISDLARPSEVGYCDMSGYARGVDVGPVGDYAYVASYYEGLRVVDVSNPTSPNEVGSCDTPGFAYGVTVASAGDYAYVASGDKGLRVVDVSTPNSSPHTHQT
jgi:hypothetical protein